MYQPKSFQEHLCYSILVQAFNNARILVFFENVENESYPVKMNTVRALTLGEQPFQAEVALKINPDPLCLQGFFK
jgi:hypothetical protein